VTLDESSANGARLRRFADGGPGGFGPGHNVVDIGAVQADRMGGEGLWVRRGDLIGLLWVAQLQSPVAEIQFGVRHRVAGSIHPLDKLGAEDRDVEVDRLGGAVDAQERGRLV
jgi:hypothetical protein